MEVIEGTALSALCDYSFGDHMGAASIPRPKGGFMKEANSGNGEFLGLCTKFERKTMTLFIDNIRLYNRPLMADPQDVAWLTHLLTRNDLLSLCGRLPHNRFIIFCSHEDTPIDHHIMIPKNVLGIHAVNAEFNNDKIHPFPYGLQREMGDDDTRLEVMREVISEDRYQEPSKLLYINCGLGGERNAKEREYLPSFLQYDWATCRFDKDSKFFPYDRYKEFLTELKNHKFMICPQGHGLDCHRNWETLYMRRVPVMKDDPYFRKLMQGFPVLFVKNWSDVTKELLEANDFLYQQALVMNMNRLNLRLIFDTIMASYEGNQC